MNKNKRSHHFINFGLQNRLIISLIVLELVLISVSVFVVYLDMNQIIEDNMFRIHIKNTLSVEYFAGRVLQVMFVLLLVNILLASFIVWRWRLYVNSIVMPLQATVSSIHKLDFTLTAEKPVRHDAVIIADQWLHREKDRFTEVRKLLSGINLDETQNALESLSRCRRLIEENIVD